MNAPSASAPASPGSVAAGPVLRDIHLPADPSWWPPAPGWWILLALLILLSLIGAWLLRRRRRQQWLLARVCGEVDQALAAYAVVPDVGRFAGELHQLLRRAARWLYPDAATRHGSAWREMLASVPVDAATLQHLIMLESWMYRAPTNGVGPAASAEQRQSSLPPGSATVISDAPEASADPGSAEVSNEMNRFDAEASAAAVRRWLSMAWRRAPKSVRRKGGRHVNA